MLSIAGFSRARIAYQQIYRKYPYSQRRAGDALFFGGECDCNDSGSIHHVGLMM